MKEWIRNLTGKEITEIYNWEHLWEDTTEEFDRKIFKMIDECQNKRQRNKPVLKKLLLAALFITLIIIPALLIITNLQNNNNLFLANIKNRVVFTIQNKQVQLKQGERLKNNTYVHTEVDSSCKIHYAEQAIVDMYEKSLLKVIENTQKRISFVLDEGKIYITEHIHNNIRIGFYTQNAYIYAISTEYSVEYNKLKNETTVKTFDGTVHIETIPKGEVIDLKAGEEAVITQEQLLLCKQPDEPEGKEQEKEWIIRTVYYNPKEKGAIIGFDTFEDYITATTRHSIICFTRDENQWEQTLKDIIISPPAIYNEEVYIPARDTVPCFDLYTGTREPDVKTKETMKPGHRIMQYDNDLYFIFPSGIYLFDDKSKALRKEPVIHVIDATLPAFYNNQLYATSYLTKNIEAYDSAGTLSWSTPLNDRSSCSPVVINDFLYTGTNGHTLYKITLYGETEKQKQIEGTIQAITVGHEQLIYVNTGNNRLFKINNQTLNVEGFYDNIKTVFIHNNIIFMGKGDGIIKIIDENTEKEIALLNSFVTAFIHHGNDYYAGLDNGYILRLEKE